MTRIHIDSLKIIPNCKLVSASWEGIRNDTLLTLRVPMELEVRAGDWCLIDPESLRKLQEGQMRVVAGDAVETDTADGGVAFGVVEQIQKTLHAAVDETAADND